nr:homoserine kinase-like [Ipomoea trifida]
MLAGKQRMLENSPLVAEGSTLMPTIGEDCCCRATNAVAGCELHETRRLGVVTRWSSAVAVLRHDSAMAITFLQPGYKLILQRKSSYLKTTIRELVDASVKSFSPATVANLGLGFDFLCCVVDGIGDFVAVHVDPDISPRQVSIFKISRAGNKLSKDPLSICADIAAITAMKKTGNGLLYLRIDGSLVTTLLLKLSAAMYGTAVKSGLWWRSYCKETEGNNGGYGFAAKNLKLGRFGTGWELFTRKFDPKMWIERMKL